MDSTLPGASGPAAGPHCFLNLQPPCGPGGLGRGFSRARPGIARLGACAARDEASKGLGLWGLGQRSSCPSARLALAAAGLGCAVMRYVIRCPAALQQHAVSCTQAKQAEAPAARFPMSLVPRRVSLARRPVYVAQGQPWLRRPACLPACLLPVARLLRIICLVHGQGVADQPLFSAFSAPQRSTQPDPLLHTSAVCARGAIITERQCQNSCDSPPQRQHLS